jgi:small ligand-binding sensory domain FIST
VALALKLPQANAAVLPFYSGTESLPELPEEAWAAAVAAPPERSPHMLVLASPPRDGAFPIERWLSRLDTALPWATKVGGLTVGDSRLWVGSREFDGGAVGLALSGIAVDALVCQGARPVSKSFEITAAEGNVIRELDGKTLSQSGFSDVLEDLAQSEQLMAGISVPTRPAAAPPPPGPGGPHAGGAGGLQGRSSPIEPSYVMRTITGYSKDNSALGVGAMPELLSSSSSGLTPRLCLHSFSAANARTELSQVAQQLASSYPSLGWEEGGGRLDERGGLMISCLGRGVGLYREANVESNILAETIGGGSPLALAGMFAGGEIGPVGGRTFVHTYTTTVALLRARHENDSTF